MSKRSLLFIAAVLVCLALLVFVSIPIKQVKEQIPFKLADGTAGEIILSAPAYLRLGDWTELGMEITFDHVSFTDESLQVKASLQAAFIEAEPEGELTAVIPIDGKGPFAWQVRSNLTGEHSVNAWCFRQDPAGQSLILAREITFEVKSILGVRYNVVRWLLSGLTFFFIVLWLLSYRRKKIVYN